MRWYFSSLLLLCGAYVEVCRSSFCGPSMFECDDKTCISRSRMCDASDDCPNGEDESIAKAECSYPRCKQRNATLASENGYDCRRRTCNPRRVNVCQGIKRCLCDDECGFSCIKPDTTCASDPPTIPNSNGYDVIRIVGRRRTVLSEPHVFKHRDMIKYRCVHGMVLVGPLVRCNSKRQWTRLLPRCKMEFCVTNECLNGGTCVSRSNTFSCRCPRTHTGARCERERYNPCEESPCENGGTCRAIGFDDIECTCSPGYSGHLCQKEIYCMTPTPPERGFITGDAKSEWRHGEEVTFQCLDEFELYGRNTIRCLGNGTWTAMTAQCTRIVCRLDYFLLGYGVIVQGFDVDRLYNNKFAVDDEVTVTCDDGYKPFLNDEPFAIPKLRCLVGGEWTPDYNGVTCEEVVTCDPPGLIEGLILNGATEPLIEGTELRARCAEGFTIEGPGVIHCLPNGSWSLFPVCIPNPPPEVTCEDPVMPKGLLHDAFPEADQFQQGDILNVRCDEGFSLIGPEAIECRNKGTWSQFPYCEEVIEVSCLFDFEDLGEGVEVDLPDGGVMKDSYSVGVRLGIFCDRRSKRPFSVSEGAISESSTCTADGTWSPRITDIRCVQICRRPSIPQNGLLVLNVQKQLYFPNETLFSECPDLYRHEGSNNITCMEDGTWSEMAPCLPVGCWIHPKLVHEAVVFEGYDNASLTGIEFRIGHEMAIICVNETLTFDSNLPQIITCEGKNIWTQDYTQYACQPGSCEGRCKVLDGICACDFGCTDRHDCCEDFEEFCWK